MMARWTHPFPYRTRKLSILALMVVQCARVGRCQAYLSKIYGGLAQLGEHLPYKQRVSGSSPLTSTIYADIAQLAEQLTCNQ